MLRWSLFLPLLSLLVIACSGSGDDDGRLKVVATTTQIGDFAAKVGGDHIALTVLLRPNQDAHDFQLQPSHLRALSQADVVLINGLGLDSFVEKAVESSRGQTVVVSKGIATREGGHRHDDDDDHDDDDHHDGDEHDKADPHVWLSVANARLMAQNIRDALAASDRANAAAYTANAEAYLRQLDALEASIRGQVSQVPEACRKLVTNHEVLGYYAEAYGFHLLGSVVPGTTTAAGASAAAIAEMAQKVRAEGVPAVFAEASGNPDLIRQVAREAGVKVVDGIYGDSLGPPGSGAATYIEMMETNTRKIVEALKGCRA